MPQGVSQTHHVHPGDLPYSTPVLRSASPSGSINTEYGPDETSQADLELTPEEFAHKIEADLRIHEQREQEIRAESKPLLMPKPKSAAEEKALFEQVMRSLRWHVQQLEDDAILENLMLRGSQVALDPMPSSNDVDVIMQSMIGSPGTASMQVDHTPKSGSPISQETGHPRWPPRPLHEVLGESKYK
ncbi:hypothetical protein EWM64_g741 [Hericium alpestre]|uniref:Uncharacterized protein n=1 Tax=Hericium alpestre TaxID=135208 RepID=A0A4Z0A875_9AGAM|nr:hypothetical protein EWM64_g741 [Hericium alpestre]